MPEKWKKPLHNFRSIRIKQLKDITNLVIVKEMGYTFSGVLQWASDPLPRKNFTALDSPISKGKGDGKIFSWGGGTRPPETP